MKGESEKRILELDGRNQEIETKLRIYEKLEQELDDVVMQAAECKPEHYYQKTICDLCLEGSAVLNLLSTSSHI